VTLRIFFCRECRYYGGYGSGSGRRVECMAEKRPQVKGSDAACGGFIGFWRSGHERS